jgi:hypothetical protein
MKQETRIVDGTTLYKVGRGLWEYRWNGKARYTGTLAQHRKIAAEARRSMKGMPK